MDNLNYIDFDKLKADLMLDNIELLVNESFKDVPVIAEVFKLGRVIGRTDILRKMQVISDACTKDAIEFSKEMNEVTEKLKRKLDEETDQGKDNE